MIDVGMTDDHGIDVIDCHGKLGEILRFALSRSLYQATFKQNGVLVGSQYVQRAGYLFSGAKKLNRKRHP